jgi:glutathione transport system substrate-binding protein
MLADAGYADGFTVTLMSTSQYGMHQSTAEIVQNNLQAIGIDCQLELYDWATVVQRHAAGDYQFRIQGTAGDLPDPDWLTNFFGSGSPNEASAGFSDPQLDELLAEGRTTSDQEARKEIYLQVEQRLLEIAPWNFLVYRQDAEAVKAEIQGYEHLPGLLGYFSGITLRKTWIEES